MDEAASQCAEGLDAEFDEAHVDPLKPFYLMLNVNNLDGTLDMKIEAPTAFGALDAAVMQASDQVDDAGGVVYIYECRPLRRIKRHSVLVDDLTAA